MTISVTWKLILRYEFGHARKFDGAYYWFWSCSHSSFVPISTKGSSLAKRKDSFLSILFAPDIFVSVDSNQDLVQGIRAPNDKVVETHRITTTV